MWLILMTTLVTLGVFCFNNLEYFLLNFRWVIIIFFLLPASLTYDLYFYVKTWLTFKENDTAASKHLEKVLNVQKQVKEWNENGRKSLMCTGRPGWKTVCLREAVYKRVYTNIHINLTNILEVDAENMTVLIEPLVSMGQVTAYLCSRGWTLPVVPELDELTIGGLIMGVGIESSSHKYGLMQNLLVSAEIVLADGSIVECSKSDNVDLFNALPWSHGSLGFLVAAKLKIIPAKKYVKLQYHPAHSFKEIIEVFTEESRNKDNDFVEGLMYSENEAIIMTGTMTDTLVEDKLNTIGSYYKPWFFRHAETFLKTGPKVEFIPLRQYYHRHTKGIFWEMQDIIPFGNNAFFRYLFGWMMPPQISFLKLTQNERIKKLYEKYQIIQDMLLPIRDLRDALLFFHKELKLYPLWLCPFTLPNESGFVHSKLNNDKLYVDIGAYGAPKVENYNSYEALRKLEKYVLAHNGFQLLYADSHLTREEFRKMFDHTLYDQMRLKYKCHGAFPDVYDKVNRKARS